MTRLEGSAGSGKTTASKIMSTLFYAEPRDKKATDAANYTDGSQNPLIVLDNIEVKQMTEDLTTFMLTGIAKEKRKSGADSETITERIKRLLNTIGVEPLRGELSEILSRSFVINFDLANRAGDCFPESEVISAIRQNRDLIISAIMKRTSHAPAMIRDGARKQVMRLLRRTMPTHGKRRRNDCLSLMYLMMPAGSEEREVTTGLEDLSPLFIEQIHSINDASQEMARESNRIATAPASLFHAYRNAVESDEKARCGEDDRANHVVGFIERCQVGFENENTMEPVSAGRLLAALAGSAGNSTSSSNTSSPPGSVGASATTRMSSGALGSTSTGSAMPTPRISSIGSARTGENEGEWRVMPAIDDVAATSAYHGGRRQSP